ncbi:MAG: cupin domain-containing protein [Kofleriaceae bacterium]
MQNVIDRRMVAHHSQAGLDVAVLIDQRNTGAAAVAVLDVRAAAGRGIGPRQPDRAELWRLATPAELVQGRARTALAPGDLVLVPAGATLELAPGAMPVGATVAVVPGGPMGVARAGALPQALGSTASAGAAPALTIVHAGGARRYAKGASAATLLLERGPLAAAVVELDAGATMPPHVHRAETEVVYLEAGTGTFTVGGVAVPVTDTMVLVIPPGVEHGYVATTATRAYQLYTPPGPEQRWKKSP